MPLNNNNYSWAACQACQPNVTPCSTDNLWGQYGATSSPQYGSGGNNFYHPTHSGNQNPNNNWQYFPEDYLKPMTGKLLPMYRSYFKWYPTITDLLFDYEQALDPNSGKMLQNIVFKSLSSVKFGEFYDGNFVTWGERYFTPTDFVITQDYDAPSLAIQIAYKNDPLTPTLGTDYQSGWRGTIGKFDTILIFRNDPAATGDEECCHQLIQKTVVAVDASTWTITFEKTSAGDTGFTFKEWDVVKKLYRGRNDWDEITNTFGVIPTNAKRSYLQHFSYTLDFTKAELNKSYASERGVLDFIANRIFHANLNMVREMGYAMWRGRNRGAVSLWGSNNTLPAETQGIITWIYEANANNSDLELITSMDGLMTSEEKVRHILEVILNVQNSGMIKKGEIVTLVCNQHAITAMLQMNNAWNKFTGFTVNTNDNTNKNFGLPIINTPNGRIEFMQDVLLTEMYPNEGVMIALPKSMIGMTTRPNQSIEVPTGSIKKATLGFNFEDVTMPKQHEIRSYDVWTEMAIVIAGIDSGAYRMIQWIVC